jgi:hypothetical protein
LATQRINPLIEKLTANSNHVTDDILRWDGEAQVRIKSVEPVLENLSALGIRKKQEQTPEQLASMKAALETHRNSNKNSP